ncbi:hypothetical protein BJY21_003132 [Kineosphaera limosa]|uniref:Uncharacterized protein n=1 Tax=Kineosphaera limosa NBRC 100340 TaxID=1184609 RepID=K6WAE5_9MICO|nr:hypothetical protein [Kineosphaera limosa]NYE01948.1 hypothetical protein [Kineosphaera limosa]GAB96175.1 hypothetical protein KILIM_032_00610 [Kineosphaera limosa NBRC 100340]
MPDVEVAVVFTERLGVERGAWARPNPGTLSLGAGHGRTLVDEIADHLGIDIITG